MPPDLTREKNDWPEAVEDFHALADYDEVIDRVRAFVGRCARQRTCPNGIYSDVVQEAIVALLDQGSKLRDARNPRAYVATIVKNEITRVKKREERKRDELAPRTEDAMRTADVIPTPGATPEQGFLPSPEELRLQLDILDALQEWCDEEGPTGRPVVVEVRRRTEAARHVDEEPPWSKMLAAVAQAVGSTEGKVRHALARLFAKWDAPRATEKWAKRRDDHRYLPVLELQIRALLGGPFSPDLFELRRCRRYDAEPDTAVRLETEEMVPLLTGKLRNVSEGGLLFEVATPGEATADRLTEHILRVEREEFTWVITPPDPTALPEIPLRGRVVRPRFDGRKWRCGVEFSEEPPKLLLEYLRRLAARPTS